MSSITNTGANNLAEVLGKILPDTKGIDTLVGYFYFSGFQEIYKKLEDKKIRILVGKEIDKKVLDKISTIDQIELDRYLKPTISKSKISSKENYYKEFSTVFNKTDWFDNSESIEAFDVFINKIKNGTLEIRKTSTDQHGKFYIFHYKDEVTQGGLQPGVVIVGSSNFTYSGFKGQGEDNLILREDHYYKEKVQRFKNLWDDSSNVIIADKNNSEEFIKEIKKRIWLYAKPSPYHLYLRVLDEYFNLENVEKMKTPDEITEGKFSSLKYQIDAINLGIDRIEKFGGVIVADVVGLGKSIVASTIAHNLELKTIVIAPPHLMDQWEDYRVDFDFNARVYSTGKVAEVYEKHKDDKNLLIILDEAHKHRNEDTDSYKKLHRLCLGNKVMALSATPFNNDPKDIYALIKLFSTPGQSTLRTVENLSTEFHNLFSEYKKLRRDLRSNKKDKDFTKIIAEKSGEIAKRLRSMIEPLVIRRSRLDLDAIQSYKDDLKKQCFEFPKVNDPILLEYFLGDLSELYLTTLNKISPNKDDGVVQGQNSFSGARYKPVFYLKPGSKFFQTIADEKVSEEMEQMIKQAQVNVAKFMRRLLVRRFESSVYAFKKSLGKMISSSEKMLSWYSDRKQVPILKKGNIPEIEDLENMDEEEIEILFDDLKNKGLILIPASELNVDFKRVLENDIKVLKSIYADWFGDNASKEDPKFNKFFDNISKLLEENKNRKIIVFSEFSDTANYLERKIKERGFERVFKYSSQDSSRENKKIIQENFDAGLDLKNQKNDFDFLVATDAISEGFNLHRAGVIINYDIPYNPTRVIQRVGRINRINKKVFDELYIYNFFPTITGEQETATKAISTLKMNLIHLLLGEDTKFFSKEEELKNYFAEQYRDERDATENLSWDAKHRNIWLDYLNNQDLIKKVRSIPHRSRIARQKEEISEKNIVAFGKRGHNYVFAKGTNEIDIDLISPEDALNIFEAKADEEAKETTSNFDFVYQKIKGCMFKNNTHNSIRSGSRRYEVIEKLRILSEKYPQSKEWCDDVSTIIKDYDSLPEGLLKDISKVDFNADSQKIFYELKKMVPADYIANIFEVAEKANNRDELIVLSEELIT